MNLYICLYMGDFKEINVLVVYAICLAMINFSKGRYVFSWGGEGWGILVFFSQISVDPPYGLIKKLLTPPPLGD